jgi:flavin prenyltransferase
VTVPARRLIVAITGASGAAYGVQLLRRLREQPDVETHLLLSAAGVLNAYQELDLKRGDVEALAHVVHSVNDIGATIASGSFATIGMVVAPCSMKTLAAIAHGYADNLIARAADVCLKERRRLVLLPREAPLNLAHIRNMEAVTLMGGVIFPPCRRSTTVRRPSRRWLITPSAACSTSSGWGSRRRRAGTAPSVLHARNTAAERPCATAPTYPPWGFMLSV